jgi:uroporphyrinogen III methyltransferase / synthase
MQRSSVNKKSLKVATRTSNLAIKQVEEVFAQFPGLPYEIVPVESFGDKHKDISLINNKIQNIFTQELDEKLLNGKADLAVHSAKDLPYPLPDGLELIALFEAFDKTDAIVSRNNQKLTELPLKPRLGTSSLLRKTELLRIRNDIQIISIRGTIDERIQQVDNGDVDSVVVATCALKRLGFENRIAEILPFETHPLQGNLALIAKSGNRKLKNIFSAKDIRKNYGKVWLVGFGPGNPELLTVKALKILKQADIIFYDDLLNSSYLSRFKAQKVSVGKRKGNHSVEQSDINRLLYNAAIIGKTVVRLKGGDPMLFAHGGEEYEYLHRHFVKVEIIPGITAALAAAAYAHIPLSHRGIASSVTFITGHSKNNIKVPDDGTAIYYMGASNLREIARKAINKGWKPDTPVLLVYNVSASDQEKHFTNLEEIINSSQIFKTPLIIMMGDVVRLKNNPSENIAKPAFLYTGTNPVSFLKFGTVLHTPLIEISPLADFQSQSNILKDIHNFNWIIFTSRYAVQYFIKTLLQTGQDVRSLAGIKIASIGNITTHELQKYGLSPDLQPAKESSNGMLELFRNQNITKQHILIPRSNLALPLLPKGLTNAGNTVITATVYENKMPQDMNKENLENIDYIVFSSPSCVENFFKLYREPLHEKKFIVQGEETFKKLASYAIPNDKIIRKEIYEAVS